MLMYVKWGTAAMDANNVKRIEWIDVAKGITILCMIAGHCFSFGSIERNLIFSFHMPIFFIFTGFTMRNVVNVRDFFRGLKKDFFRLIVPAVVIQSINLFFSIFVAGGALKPEIIVFIKQLFWASAVDIYGNPALGALWFLFAMFWAKQIYHFVNVFLNSKYSFIVYFMLAVCGKIISSHYWLPQSFDIALVAVLFIWTGNIIRQYWDIIEKNLLVITTCAFALWMFWWQTGVYIELGTRSYPQFIVCIVEAIMGSICIFILGKALEANKLISKYFSMIGKETLIILGVHHLDMWASFFWNRGAVWEVILWRTIFDLVIAAGIVLLYRRIKLVFIQ